jgi:hypothetical protein|tara:strand:- start:6073 stop:6339 length:267 start_codon:yes stop_codon:yes gene_type:complete
MVRIKTKNMDFSYDNPWIQVTDVPPLWKKAWKWLTSPHRRLKARVKRIIRWIGDWQPRRKWLTGVLLGVWIGFVLTIVLLYVIGTLLY